MAIITNNLPIIPPSFTPLYAQVRTVAPTANHATQGADHTYSSVWATGTSFKTQSIHRVEGDTSFSSISLNKLSLNPGTYSLAIPMAVDTSVQSMQFQFFNVTDGIVEHDGYAASTAPVFTGAEAWLPKWATQFFNVIVPSVKQFEIRTKSIFDPPLYGASEFLGDFVVIKIA